jgi:hypothetical protein
MISDAKQLVGRGKPGQTESTPVGAHLVVVEQAQTVQALIATLHAVQENASGTAAQP